MTNETLLLVGRDTGNSREVISTHAERLRDRNVASSVRVSLYEEEPVRELKEPFRSVDSGTVYAVPMCVGHTHETRDRVPRALSYVPGNVRYCDPPGRSPALAGVVADRAAGLTENAAEPATTLVLVGFGSSSLPHQRRTVEDHATRLRDRSEFGDVLTCYLLQNPAVECVRYNVSTDHAVAVPLFMAESEITEEEIPAKLELDRGGIAYADSIGDHPRVTDLIHAEVTKQRTLAEGGASGAGFDLSATRRPVATDGEGT